MVMRRTLLFGIGSMLLAAAAVFTEAIRAVVHPVERAIVWLWDLLAPAFNEYWPDLGTDDRRREAWGGTRVDPALLNSLRHEAGMRPLTG